MTSPGSGTQTASRVVRRPLEEIKRRVVGKTLVDLDGARERVRTQETNLGNLIADAYLEKARKAIPETQLALVNGGGIRASIPAGDVTLGQVLEVMPFNNMLVILRLTGAEILEALENGVSKVEDEHGRFPQVAGMRYAFDPARPAGSASSASRFGTKRRRRTAPSITARRTSS